MEQSFEWDEAKNIANRLKHGVSFEIVYEFDWDRAVFRPDNRFDYGEERVVAFGRIAGAGFAIVYCSRNERVRIISVRRAHEKEMRAYDL